MTFMRLCAAAALTLGLITASAAAEADALSIGIVTALTTGQIGFAALKAAPAFGLFGLASLLSAWRPRPLMFFVARAFEAGVQALGWPGVQLELSPQETDLKVVDAALHVLASASPLLKKQILLACATCIGVDGQETIEEGELLRASSDSLDCPMPPLLGHGGVH